MILLSINIIKEKKKKYYSSTINFKYLELINQKFKIMNKLTKIFLSEDKITRCKNIPYFINANIKNMREFKIHSTSEIMGYNVVDSIYKSNSSAINFNGREIIDYKSFENIFTKRERKINELIEENNSSIIELTSPSEKNININNPEYNDLREVKFHHLDHVNHNIVNFIYIWWRDKNYSLYRDSLDHKNLPRWLFTTDCFDTPKSMITFKENWLKSCNNEKSLDQILINIPEAIKKYSHSDKSLKFYYKLEMIDSDARALNNLINETNKGIQKLIKRGELINKLSKYKSIENFIKHNDFTMIFLDDIRAKNFVILSLIINNIKGGKDWIINYDKNFHKKNNLTFNKITTHPKFMELNGNYIDEWTLDNLKEYYILGTVNYVKKYLRKNI